MSIPFNSIKTWAVDDRPREKAQTKGLSALSDTELIAILIGNGTKSKSALDLAKDVYDFAKRDFNNLAKIEYKDLSKAIKGIGPAKAITIAVAMEISRRRKIETSTKLEKVQSSETAYQILKPYLEDKTREEFFVLYLNKNGIPLLTEQHTTGGIDSTVVDKRLILKKALQLDAVRIILAHNHPSGNLSPSQADEKTTQDLKRAADLLQIALIDHIIISQNGYYSFADNSKL